MSRRWRWAVALVLIGGLVAFGARSWLVSGEAGGGLLPEDAQVSRQPRAHRQSVRPLKELRVPTEAYDPYGVNLSHADLSGLDLSERGDLLDRYAGFDTATIWPRRLPDGFNPGRRMELGKDPGLGVRELHQHGINGEGVHVAFVDQTLLLEHREYAGRLVRYEEIGRVANEAEMHGAAVASVMVGETVGVAPEARFTYYAAQLIEDGKRTFSYYARAIHEILDRNQELPPAERVRAIGLSVGPRPDEVGYPDLMEAIERAREEGVFVAATIPTPVFLFGIQGLDRLPDGNPNDPAAYLPGVFWREEFYREPEAFAGLLLLPMDARTVAAETGPGDYRYDRQSGLSWSVPYLVGVYALALQVEPDLTPDRFFRVASETGFTVNLSHDGRTYTLGPIVNPAGIVQALQNQG